ncbi:MAG: phage SPO1 DNA polymerase-related protein [Gallionellaceae bacterium]|nr:MAG: phage SPO1 DNA polymerase-related protein [Gallionellaceae bacterium]
MTARTLAQAAHQRFSALVLELDADYCNNTFGSAPCTATGTQCYNTFGTCKDRANYAKGTKTFRFCSRGMAIPPGETLRPYILSHAFTPTEIPLCGGLAARSQTTLTMADETCSDIEADKYAAIRSLPATGTFWTRFIARNYNIQGRFARVRKGYVTSPWDWTVFQNELYVIEAITGPDSEGNVQVVLADATKTLDKAMLPEASDGKLQQDLKAIENSGIAQAGGAATITLAAAASAVDSYYNGMEVYVTENTGAGQRRVISGYVGATRVATVSAAWSVVPNSTSVYQIGALGINVGTGKGAQYDDPVATGLPQFVRIGDEVVRYTAIAGDVLSWADTTSRAQFGTIAEDHKQGDGVQLCFAPVNKSVTDVIHRLANAAGLADAYLDLAGLATEDSNWLGAGAAITACIHTPEKASGLLDELLAATNLNAWWDAAGQILRFKADMPQNAASVITITPEETIGKSMQVTPLDGLRITRSFMSFAPFSATENMGEAKNFGITNGYIDASAESANEYNAVTGEHKFSRWMGAANSTFVSSTVGRRVNRLRDAPFKLSFALDPRNEVHVGDLIDVTSRKKANASGAPALTRMRVIKYLDDRNIEIEAISTTFARRYGFIAPNGYPDYASASEAQRNYAFIAAANGLMSDGSSAYFIS